MAVTIKSDREIELMRESGHLLARVQNGLADMVKAGMSTYEINAIGEKLIRDLGCIPSFLNYEGYPASICVSVNEEIVHGIPSEDKFIKDGDIVSLDAGLIYKGYHSDCARTLIIGDATEEARKLTEVTKQSFFEGIRAAKAGNHLYDISDAIDRYVTPFGYGIVEDMTGHGIGTSMHEDPMIPNYHQDEKGIYLQPGMTLAIEPMINAGSREIKISDNGWTVSSADGSLSAHYENTILITEGDPEILTMI
jgi:methionyl aminopeptidase